MDENVPEPQRLLLRRWRIRGRQIGLDIGSKRMTDEEIIRLLQQLRRPTFFTRDVDFYEHELCHECYCLVWLDVGLLEIADYVRRVLRHPAFKTQSARMGCVIAAAPTGLTIWRQRQEQPQRLPWND